MNNERNIIQISELYQMDGLPVYAQFGDGVQGWAIVAIEGTTIYLYGPNFDDHYEPDTDFYEMEYNDPYGHFGLHLLGWRTLSTNPLTSR